MSFKQSHTTRYNKPIVSGSRGQGGSSTVQLPPPTCSTQQSGAAHYYRYTMARDNLPAMTLGPEYLSHGYVTRTILFGGRIKLLVDDILVLPDSDRRNPNYGETFVTIGLINELTQALTRVSQATFHRPIPMIQYTWLNATYSESFSSFRVRDSNGYHDVSFNGFMPPSQGAIKTRLLVNMYISRPALGGDPVIRVKVVDGVVRQFVVVEVPSDDMFPGGAVTQIDNSDEDDVNDSLASAFGNLGV